ncbi:MAG: Ketoisovalerate oxidoreductase subunit VorD [Candidatus Bathyarchaeota archaeon BA2]|nr:MAG: Ketoisovalerate oxidoreductase subunit VorD [Candidatus Bathyarchaeota archaeon BA2]
MVRILLRFSEEIVDQPITAQVILEHGIPISIVAAHIDSQGGEILAEVPETHVEKIIDAFREKGVTVTVPKLIEVDTEKCFECGACLSLCPVSAIAFKEDSSVVFDEEKCIGSPCGLCIDACPAKAIKLVEQHSSYLNR